MRHASFLHSALFALLCVASAVQAAPMNKCVINGSVSYQQDPCPSGQPRKEPSLEELNAAERKRRAAAASAAAAAPPAPTVHMAPMAQDAARPSSPEPVATPRSFSCDGRKYCSQMRSCAEAKYFLANCPGVKMDGDNDGIPCEEQWCRP